MSTVQDSWKLGPWALSWSPSHGQFHRRLTTKGHLCVSHGCCFTHQLSRCDLRMSGLVQIFKDCMQKCRGKLLEQPYTHVSSNWPRDVWSNWKSLHIVYSVKFLHVMWTMESPICTNGLRIHLESVHPVIKSGKDCWWSRPLTWIGCQMWCCSIQDNQETNSFVSNFCWSLVHEDKISKFCCL